LPDGEFPSGPLVVKFSTPQRSVRLRTGLDRESPAIQASLRALDEADRVVVKSRPIDLGPGPTPIDRLMEVTTQRPITSRVELWFSGAAVQVIDSLEFDSVGPDYPHGVLLGVSFVNPESETVTTT
jgi:hypothetical protein